MECRSQLSNIGSKTLYGCAHGAGAIVAAGTSTSLAAMVAWGCMAAEGMTEVFLIGATVTAFAVPLILVIGLTHCLGGDKAAILAGTLVGIATIWVIPSVIFIPFLPHTIVALAAALVAVYKKPVT